MRLGPVLFAGLARLLSPVAADWLETIWYCDYGLINHCGLSGYASHFHTDYGSYEVDADEGCRSTSVLGMTDFCVDWEHTRGHFKFDHQSYKRCFQKNYAGDKIDCKEYDECWRDTWPEVPCTW